MNHEEIVELIKKHIKDIDDRIVYARANGELKLVASFMKAKSQALKTLVDLYNGK